MKIDIKKKMREVKWITEHTLTTEQFNELIKRKSDRSGHVASKPKQVDSKELQA